ncbi:MAG: M24 family metallopeptidase [Anaerotardibacter sp.]
MARISRIREKMLSNDLDCLYIRSLSNLRWATGFKGVFDTEDAHALIVTESSASLHTDSRYITAFMAASEGTEIVCDASRQHHFDFLSTRLSEEYGVEDDESSAVKNSLFDKESASDEASAGEEGLSLEDESLSADEPFVIRVGIETSMTLAEFRLLERKAQEASLLFEFVELDGFIEELRQVKDESEIEAMVKAQEITDRAFEHICSFIAEGMTEKEVQLELDRFMLDNGADGLAFDTIIATGAHGASPHAQPGDTVISSGDCVVMDFGAKYDGYCSDMTRCVFIDEPSQELRDAWNLLRKVNETCESVIKEGVSAKEVHALAESLLAEGGYEGAMGHSLGHSVGIDIHESPNLSPNQAGDLVQGNVVTVEPGIYIPGKFGMRLEDFGIVSKNGFRVFTKSSHDMVIISR